MRDLTNGFLRNDRWAKDDEPLLVSDDEPYGLVLADGFWQSTDARPDSQLLDPPTAAKIECSRGQGVCSETDAEVNMTLLQPDSREYKIMSWTSAGILADYSEERLSCGIGHRLAIDFKANSVIVTDYPTKLGISESCGASQAANSLALHGGRIGAPGPNNLDQIFDCSAFGANSAILSKVTEFHGYVVDKAYSLWLDNGDGGSPATLKTPDHRYSRQECERLMEKKLKEL